MKNRKIQIEIEVKSDKKFIQIKRAIEKGIYRGLDTSPNYIAAPKDVSILSIIELKGNEDRIKSAGHYLCGDSDLSVEEMLELIDNYDGDPTDLIDDIDGVVVWEPLIGSLTVERFLMEV